MASSNASHKPNLVPVPRQAMGADPLPCTVEHLAPSLRSLQGHFAWNLAIGAIMELLPAPV